MQKPDQLIRTKLRLPFTRARLVPRRRLEAMIAKGLKGPLTLIAAPAGFGKTTLIATHVCDCGMPVAWLSLDKNDNQVNRFLSYLVAALQEADSRIGGDAVQLLQANEPVSPEIILTELINDLDVSGQDIALVLDDFQFIKNQVVHDAVAFLIEHCPATFHLVIASRSDPPLPLARLRARGHLVELRAAELRFTNPEVTSYLNDVMELNLDTGLISLMEERTEGWIAGLQMASIALQSSDSLRGVQEARQFIEAFSGTNRYILDYLLEEVLASQSPEVQRFLLYTSILERLNAELCNAVLADAGMGEDGDQGRLDLVDQLSKGKKESTLEYLERANLFLVPLDDERRWYRYHHLFSDLLRAQLHKKVGEDDVARLHLLASEWHERNGSVLESIQHASMAGDVERVEILIGQNYMEMMNRGEMSWIRSWTGSLSGELVSQRPWLCIYEAQNHAWYGELDEADRLLDEAEKIIRSLSPSPEINLMKGHLFYVRSRVTAMRGDISRAIGQCLAARELIPASNQGLQIDTSMTLGYEYFLSGDYQNARKVLDETIRMGMISGSVINTVAAHCILARLHAVQGEFRQSLDLYQHALKIIPEESGQHLGARAMVEAGISEVLCERNDLETALQHNRQSLKWMPWWGKADDYVLAYVTQARILLSQAKTNEAAEAVGKASELVRKRGVFSEALNVIDVCRVKLWLHLGDLPRARHWAAAQDQLPVPEIHHGFTNELIQITRGRVMLADSRTVEADKLLAQVEDNARIARRMSRVIEALLLRALVMQQDGELEQAVLVIKESLELALPEGYVRIFLDEGKSMKQLLESTLTRLGQDKDSAFLRTYIRHLLSCFESEPGSVAVKEPGLVTGNLVEPLSQREMEVLDLIAQGHTNKAIGQVLVVSPGTVKAHSASIYRKLDVSNRTEAVARARQLGILD